MTQYVVAYFLGRSKVVKAVGPFRSLAVAEAALDTIDAAAEEEDLDGVAEAQIVELTGVSEASGYGWSVE